MGSLQLACPLCCSEVFSCHNSLKYHLLSITDNLNCSICNEKFDEINDLAMHIGRKCLDEERESDEIAPVTVAVQENVDENLFTILEETKVILNDHMQEGEAATSPTAEEEATEDFYYCSSCDTNFTSIEKHIFEFHQGHEVLLESDTDVRENEGENILLAKEEVTEEEPEELMSQEDLLNTVQEEECFDKDGRLFIRKIVKIDKLWDNKESSSAETIVQFLQCLKCKLKFQTPELFYKHSCGLQTIQGENKKFKPRRCKVCNACFVNSYSLAVHMKTHTTKSDTATASKSESELNAPFICEICNTEFPAYKSLRLHKRMHEPVKSKDIEPPVNYDMLGEEVSIVDGSREMFLCTICKKPYDKEYEEAHKKFHVNDDDFNCETCNRKFYSKENLDMHMKAHVDSKKFGCSYCKKKFLTQEKLDVHISSNCQDRQYACQYCGRRFARPHEKVKHERIHTGEKPHVCEICGKAFRVSYCLTLHMRTHSGTRPYKCECCGKRFKAHSVYNHHLLTHSEDRKYKCPYCPKTFKTGVQLAGHKNTHTKPFICTKCQRPFASLYSVRAHMETHDRQNNLKYQCMLCGASYARSFALRDHIKEQHTKEPEGTHLTIDSSMLDSSVDYPIIESVETTSDILPDGEGMLIDINSEVVEHL